jgi:hypothetical protein
MQNKRFFFGIIYKKVVIDIEVKVNKNKKNVKGIIISLCAMIVIYVGLSIYFSNHFYFGSKINGINVAGKTVEQADEKISSSIDKYTLKLVERGDLEEQIEAVDIGLKYNPEGKSQALKDSQNAFGWIFALFKASDSEMNDIVSYDETLLRETLNKLSCFDNSKIIEPKNAAIEYKENSYEISQEVSGNKINKDILYNNVLEAILNDQTTINLDETNSYEAPLYTKDSQKIIDAKNSLNKYIDSTITYTINGVAETLNSYTIHNWLEIDENFGIIFNEGKIGKYVDTLSSKYNTTGQTRNFITSLKTPINISGGNYGWKIDRYGQIQDIISSIKDGQVITKEPIYISTAKTHDANDIGNTYVEINFTKQHLWFYKNGSLVVDGDIVSGNVSTGATTPTGVYILNNKEKNATLKGEDYSVPVGFWMPFNGGIGIHDATWRTEFGKDIYLTNGSHGCINAPYEVAKVISENIEIGTPVVCYYS